MARLSLYFFIIRLSTNEDIHSWSTEHTSKANQYVDYAVHIGSVCGVRVYVVYTLKDNIDIWCSVKGLKQDPLSYWMVLGEGGKG
jgi:hypothetical protein